MALTYAKLVTANGEHTLSHRQLDELRMLLAVRESLGVTPTADPPVMESTYDEIQEWIEQDFDQNRGGNTEYLDG